MANNEQYTPASAEEIRRDILRDMQLEGGRYGATPPVSPGTDSYIWANSWANAQLLQYQNLAGARAGRTPLDATGQDLIDWRDSLGLPELPPSGSSGRVIVGVSGGSSITLSDGLQAALPNGLAIKVNGNQTVSDGGTVDVVAVGTGSATNAAAGTIVTWYGGPYNLLPSAKVDSQIPLSAGRDAEDEPRLRRRIFNRLQNAPSGGNWGHVRELALNANIGISDAFPYCALGGPASARIVLVKDFDPDTQDFSRAVSSAVVSAARAAIQAELPVGDELDVASCVDQPVDVAIQVTIPDSTQTGGNGNGWIDPTPWPPLVVGDGGNAAVIGVSSGGSVVEVDAGTAVSPIAGQTHIALWFSADCKFRRFLVTSVAGSAGSWLLTLDTPALDAFGNVVATGDYISPDAHNIVAYGDDWLAQMRALGPAENTADVFRLPRSKRQPYTTDESPSDLTNTQLSAMQTAHKEITDIAYSYRSATTPTVPGAVSTDPNVFVPRYFGIYAL